jgi:hypothetical protein
MAQQNTQTVLRSYQHAARIFTDSNFRLSPKYGHLFYVEFDFHPLITEISNRATQELGMVVKSASLPKYTIDTKVHNAYNRKNIVQNKINYDAVNISFHDDQAENVKQFWYDYYSYFYRDPDYADATYGAQHKYQSRPSFDWGYSPRAAVGYNNANGVQPYQYIQAIRIYSLFQGNFSEYQLINPIITKFSHGDHNMSSTEMLQTDMTVQYETVKYLEGKVTRDTVGGFIDLHYDTTPSPLGEGQQFNTNSTVITDLANNQTAINPLMRTDTALASASGNPSIGVASLLQQVTGGTAGSGSNGGGYSIPSLGSLTQGVSGSAVLKTQLQSAGIGLVGSATSQLASGITGAVAKGIGPNGNTILGLAASAIANPSQALKTVENMALAIGMGIGINLLNQGVASVTQTISGSIEKGIDSGLGSLNQSLAFGEGQTTFLGGVSQLKTDFSEASQNLLNGSGFVTNATLQTEFADGTGPYAIITDPSTGLSGTAQQLYGSE